MGIPVSNVKDYVAVQQTLIGRGLHKEAVALFTDIERELLKADNILKRFQSLARSHAVEPAPVPLRPVLEDASAQARQRGVQVTLICSEDLVIHADLHKITSCFDELVSNALYWFDKPSRELTIEAHRADPAKLPQSLGRGREYVLIYFKDNGKGISFEHKKKIFHPHFTTRPRVGAGLGLHDVGRIIDRHGGLIEEHGRPGAGAVFWIYLPLAPLPLLAG
jgi:signal transduction histidine kinase